ncbi:MAG: hypothetical protein V4450_10840 [Bacteroidota bacterium]
MEINTILRISFYLRTAPFSLARHLLFALFLLSPWGNYVSGQENKEVKIRLTNPSNKTLIEIDLPGPPELLSPKKKTLLIFFALPNGNSIEWTRGKQIQSIDDWHYDIQHIAAQTRYLRKVMSDRNVIVAYMANELKSWPAWKKQQPNGPAEIKRIVDSVTGIFERYKPDVVLNSHSGGGSFIFGYLDAVDRIPAQITRIAFIDSDYGYEDSLHTKKLADWLSSSKKHFLNVLAYNDSVVIFNGKPLVSPTGGTWYRTKLMQRKLEESFRFTYQADTSLIHYTALSKRVDIYLKTNNEGKIYHTEQVARNGFIHTILSGTHYQKKANYVYWGERVYTDWILP